MDNKHFCHKTVERLLEEKGAVNPCQRCNETSFAVIDEMTHLPLQKIVSEPYKNGATLPVALVVCRNCGAVTAHALGALDLIPSENRYDEEES